MKRLFLSVLSLFFTACATTNTSNVEVLNPTTTAEFAETSVQILHQSRGGGGSGVIYRSTDKGTTVLTNRHVCVVTTNGGWVLHNDKYYVVDGYKPSKFHDVCFVHIRENLGVNTELAPNAPKRYSAANISGHPNLLPHVRSRGDFSSEEPIQLVVGMKPCTAKDLEKMEKEGDFDSLLMCIFLGGLPIYETFDSQLVTGLILPGSSGSAVFNDESQIAGLVFASASRELHYAQVVPLRYVKFFVEQESKNKGWTKPVAPAPKASAKKVKSKRTFQRAPLEVKRKPDYYDFDAWQKLFLILEKRAALCKQQKLNCLPQR